MLNRLIELLASKKGGKKGAMAALEQQIGKSSSTIYRKIKGESGLPVASLQTLLHENGYAWAIFEGKPCDTTIVTRVVLKSLEEGALQEYLRRLWQELQEPIEDDQATVLVFARDIPFLHYVCLPDLLCFSLFDWAHMEGYDTGHFDEFAARYRGICRRIAASASCSWYLSRPSIELWNECTLVSLFRAITFHVRCKRISADSLASIERDLLEVVTKLRQWVKKGCKDELGAVSFDLYQSYANLDANVVVYRYAGQARYLMTLNACSHLQSNEMQPDEKGRDVQLNSIFSRSSSLTAMSEVDKANFFHHLEMQINDFFYGFKEQ